MHAWVLTQLCAQAAAAEAVAGRLCDAAKLAGDAAVARLQPLHAMHEGSPAGSSGGDEESPPADAAAGLASIVQALQLTFSDLLGPLRTPPSRATA